jgi:putative endonuclease
VAEHRRTLGAQGEALAAAHLSRAGYRIVGRNVRAGGVELDLIAARGNLCVFVEVKTRRSRNQGLPEEAVDARKRERLVRGAAAWMREQGARARRVRFDVIAVEPSADGGWTLRHLPGAFDASQRG